MIESRLSGTISPLALDLIDRQAQGNPFFVEELVDALCADGGLQPRSWRWHGTADRWNLSAGMVKALQQTRSLVRTGDEWRLADEVSPTDIAAELPDSIHGAVLARYDRLDEADKLTLKVASVIGQTAPLDLLNAAHPAGDPTTANADRLDKLARQNFLRRSSRRSANVFEFVHNITQEVIYRLLLKEQRQDLHLRVGRALEDTTPTSIRSARPPLLPWAAE